MPETESYKQSFEDVQLSCGVVQAVAARDQATQDLTDAKRKFVQMARRKQAEHIAKVLLKSIFSNLYPI